MGVKFRNGNLAYPQQRQNPGNPLILKILIQTNNRTSWFADSGRLPSLVTATYDSRTLVLYASRIDPYPSVRESKQRKSES